MAIGHPSVRAGRHVALRIIAGLTHFAQLAALIALGLLGVQEAASAWVSWPGEGAWFCLTALALLLTVATTFIHWESLVCARCMRSHPLSPAAESRHHHKSLWLYHRGGWVAAVFVAGYLLAVLLGHRHLAAPGLAVPLLFTGNLAAALMIQTMGVHRRLAFWCQRCDKHREYSCASNCTRHLRHLL